MSRRPSLYNRIRMILESARSGVLRTVNTTQVIANWLVGREIVEEEQHGKRRASYGKKAIEALSKKLQTTFGQGYSVQNLFYMRQFYLTYPDLLPNKPILHATRGELVNMAAHFQDEMFHAMRGTSADALGRHISPGTLNPGMSWTHYRTLLRVEKPEARAFYEIEAMANNWTARELERQINSLLYERLALSKDKKGLMDLATKGQEVQKPGDAIKDPLIMEFLGIPSTHQMVETQLEQALISNLQFFLLELGKGFAFVSRQERITLDGDHFYIDLVFYHTILKCYVLIDLKVGKLTHQDLGQLQFYVNYFDQERVSPGDHPTIGLILCTDKNDAVVRYTLGKDQNERLFASRYKLHLPTEAELRAEIKRELGYLSPSLSTPAKKSTKTANGK
ncbi:MAG: PDDEXK nuclease domain-containing protein [Desulfobacterales bacterium]